MNDLNIILSLENRLHLNKAAGTLMHVFGEGYFITDEYGREVNTLVQEKEFVFIRIIGTWVIKLIKWFASQRLKTFVSIISRYVK